MIREVIVGRVVVCARCGAAGTTNIVEFSAVTLYLDLCESHLAEVLRGAREVAGSENRIVASRQHEK